MPYIKQMLVVDGSLVLSVDEKLRDYAEEWMPSLPATMAQSHPAGQSIQLDIGKSQRRKLVTKPSLALGSVEAWLDTTNNSAWLEDLNRAVAGSIDFSSGIARLTIDVDKAPSPREVTSLLTITAALLLVRRGRTPVHAAAVVHPANGFALLLVGDSHAGKSTTTANLVKAGWFYLSDDYVVLSRASDRDVMVEGWPDDFHLDQGWRSGEFTDVRGTVRENEFRDDARQRTAKLAGILFPRVDRNEPTEILPVTAAVALERLIRQSPWLIADASSARDVLDLMKTAATLNSADLRLGSDTYANPELLNAIVRRFADRAP